jgi:hypothetical protein
MTDVSFERLLAEAQWHCERANFMAAALLLKKAVPLGTLQWGRGSLPVARASVVMADCLMQLGEHVVARDVLQRALNVFIPRLGKTHPESRNVVWLILEAQVLMGHSEVMLSESAKILALIVQHEPGGQEEARCRLRRADIFIYLKKPAEALGELQLAMAIWGPRAAANAEHVYDVANCASEAFWLQGRTAEAVQLCLCLEEHWSAALGQRHPWVAAAMERRARCLKDPRLAQQALDMLKTTLGHKSKLVAALLEHWEA